MEVTSIPIGSVRCDVAEPSQVGEARRVALALAGQLGFGEAEAGRVGIVATEAATNLVKHARHGEIVLRALHDGARKGLELLALDQGPGIADVTQALRDGYSTAGSAGTGLGSMSRLAQRFEIYSTSGAGTAVVAQIWAEPATDEPTELLESAAVCLPKRGEIQCGDAWAVVSDSERTRVLVADGLGHGPQAAQAAQEAVRVFREAASEPPAAILHAAHAVLRSTRGAAMAVAELDPARRNLRFAGVGNIAGAVVTLGQSRSLASYNGTVGFEMRKVQEFDYPFPRGAVLVLCSDGLQSQWRLDRYPGLLQRHPALIAGVLYRDFQRGRDDVTVFAARDREEPR